MCQKMGSRPKSPLGIVFLLYFVPLTMLLLYDANTSAKNLGSKPHQPDQLACFCDVWFFFKVSCSFPTDLVRIYWEQLHQQSIRFFVLFCDICIWGRPWTVFCNNGLRFLSISSSKWIVRRQCGTVLTTQIYQIMEQCFRSAENGILTLNSYPPSPPPPNQTLVPVPSSPSKVDINLMFGKSSTSKRDL